MSTDYSHAHAHAHAQSLAGRAVIVTGAAQGVGKGIAGALLERGASVLLVDPALTRFGRVNALVNNVIACNEPKALVDITAEDYDLVFDVGPRATFFLMQAVYPTMKAAGEGVIVNLGSGSGTGGLSQFAAYGAAKEAIRGMSKAAALEWGRDNVKVNVIYARGHWGSCGVCSGCGRWAHHRSDHHGRQWNGVFR